MHAALIVHSPSFWPCCTAQAQAAATGADMGGMGGMSANLEVNPTHPAVIELKRRVTDAPRKKSTNEYAQLLYDVAAVSSGYEVAMSNGRKHEI